MFTELKEIKKLPSVSFKERKKLPSVMGVYFVLDGENLLYIGCSKNIRRRWANGHHRLEWINKYSNQPSIYWLDDSSLEFLKWIERELIKKLNPRFNNYRVSMKALEKGIEDISEDKLKLYKAFLGSIIKHEEFDLEEWFFGERGKKNG